MIQSLYISFEDLRCFLASKYLWFQISNSDSLYGNMINLKNIHFQICLASKWISQYQSHRTIFARIYFNRTLQEMSTRKKKEKRRKVSLCQTIRSRRKRASRCNLSWVICLKIPRAYLLQNPVNPFMSNEYFI